MPSEAFYLYEDDRQKAQQFVDEGWQSTVFMPSMPFGDPWPSIRKVLKAESAIRRGVFDGRDLQIGPIGATSCAFSQIYGLSKKGDAKQITRLRRKMSSSVYEPYIEKRRKKAVQRPAGPKAPVQEELFGNEEPDPSR